MFDKDRNLRINKFLSVPVDLYKSLNSLKPIVFLLALSIACINYNNTTQQQPKIFSQMSSLSLVEAKLPPGYRFHPRDDELVCDYLSRKANHGSEPLFLVEVDLNKCEPWDIPETACVGGKEWYFYSQRDRKYATGVRKNRATRAGYWKATGKDRTILRKGTLVGMRKTLVFYQGRAPRGTKTNWVMHEFRLDGPFAPPNISSLKGEDWVLCRLFNKNREVPISWRSYLEEGSSPIAQLIDPYINFDQTEANFNQEQASCLLAQAHMQSNILLQAHIPTSFSLLDFPS